MRKYHGLPITPESAAVHAIQGGCAFVSYRHRSQLQVAISVCQSIAIDNGAFSAWKAKEPIEDWSDFYKWAEECISLPICDFVVIPDVIDGDENANDALLNEWPHGKFYGSPVWHMHESLDRLNRLVHEYPRVCIGSSGDFSKVGNANWWERISLAMDVACDKEGKPFTKLHGLRMLDPEIFSRLPLSSADSTNIGRNIGLDQHWRGSYPPATKEGKAVVLRQRIESKNGCIRWDRDNPISLFHKQDSLFL